jgi:hypothetical protein
MTSTPDRRPLRFATPAEALADAERLAAADRAGTLRRAGEWTAGQCLGHLAAWIDYAFDGYPFTAPPEMAARARERLPLVLEKGMTAGVRIPGVEGGTTGTDDLPADEGLARLRRAWARLEASPPPREHAFFGPLTHAQWVQLNLRHSELHQGWLHP